MADVLTPPQLAPQDNQHALLLQALAPLMRQSQVQPNLPGGSTGDQTLDQLGIGSSTPQPAAPAQSAQPGGIKKYLSNFLYGFGESAKVQAGLPTDYEKSQAAIKNSQAQQTIDINRAYKDQQGDYYGGKNKATIDAANTRANASTQNAVTKLQGTLAQHGYGIVQDADGNITGTRPLKPEEMSGEALAKVQRDAAISEYQQAAAAAQRAHADVLTNPNNPTYQQKERHIQAQLAMAQQKLNLAISSNGRQNAQFGINNGVMPDGSAPSVVGNGALVDDKGNPIGKNFQTLNAPTAATKTAAEQGQIIKDAGTTLKALINENRAFLGGNMDAILNSAFQGTPLSDPKQARVASQVRSFAALQPRLHGLRGKAAQDEFKAIIGSNYNNPDSMIEGINGMMETGNAVSKVGIPRTNVNTPKVGDAVGDYLSKFKKKQ